MGRVASVDDVSLASFLRVLGTGSTGTVWLVENQNHDGHQVEAEWNALKVSPVSETARSEQAVLAKLRQPFIIQFYGSTCDLFKSYMLVEACFFGDLASLLRPGEDKRKVLSEDRTRDIAVRIVSALDYIHSLSIVYRDLKPENIILDDKGLIKLVDFGLAKATTEMCYTMCGTVEYLAPEVVQVQGHHAAVDWWALGVCIYEMLHGRTPFSDVNGRIEHDEAPIDVCRRITHPDFKVEYDCALSKDATSCIKRLLRRKPATRLGSGGGCEVRAHAWFASVDWSKLTLPTSKPDVSVQRPILRQKTSWKLLSLEPTSPKSCRKHENATGGLETTGTESMTAFQRFSGPRAADDDIPTTGAPYATLPPGRTSGTLESQQGYVPGEVILNTRKHVSSHPSDGASKGRRSSHDDVGVVELFCMV